jgi:hypothetical protein
VSWSCHLSVLEVAAMASGFLVRGDLVFPERRSLARALRHGAVSTVSGQSRWTFRRTFQVPSGDREVALRAARRWIVAMVGYDPCRLDGWWDVTPLRRRPAGH